MFYLASLYLMAALYAAAGVNHFVNPDFYRPMMPPFLPFPDTLALIAGAAEILLGVGLCFPQTRRWAAMGVIALLIAVFPANIYMWSNGGQGYDVPQWVLLARLPLQFVLIGWAYLYV